MAERIGNLLGRLQFSDDQLQRTQKGLKEAGVAMPNFGNVGRELAKEINEPEIETGTDDERGLFPGVSTFGSSDGLI
jgi:Ras GTPase-activating-like protein IQGAP2/3